MKPILFNSEMVRAIVSGQKTQTRRIIKPEPLSVVDNATVPYIGTPSELMKALEQSNRKPPYVVGDTLYVRETWAYHKLAINSHQDDKGPFVYAADPMADQHRLGDVWRPSIHMPKYAARIFLEVANVRAERLHNISEQDCWDEGCEEIMHDFDDISQIEMAKNIGSCIEDMRPVYALLWEKINGAGSWDANPWLWVVNFKKVSR